VCGGDYLVGYAARDIRINDWVADRGDTWRVTDTARDPENGTVVLFLADHPLRYIERPANSAILVERLS